MSKHDNSNGLGLAITKSIIELHHGTIQFTQSNEYVTTFTITLPNNSHNLPPENISVLFQEVSFILISAF